MSKDVIYSKKNEPKFTSYIAPFRIFMTYNLSWHYFKPKIWNPTCNSRLRSITKSVFGPYSRTVKIASSPLSSLTETFSTTGIARIELLDAE